MIRQKNNFIWFKMNGISRLLLVHLLSAKLPLYIVNEYPKSGGSWLSQMLSEALDIPFPRNRLPMFRSSIIHGHYSWPGNMKNVVVLWRDGRDVLISQYYHSLFLNEKGNNRLVDITRRQLKFTDYMDISNNLCEFIEYTYRTKSHPRFSWAEFFQVWGNRTDVIHVKYEDLRKSAAIELQRIVQELNKRYFAIHLAEAIIDKYSFEKQSGRKPGQEDTGSFMRKGVIGDWENHFTGEAKKLFDKYAGEVLIELGYEKSHTWAKE